MTDALNQLVRRHAIKLGTRQIDILRNQIGDGSATRWTPGTSLVDAAIVLLDEAPAGIAVDLLLRALPAEAVVVIPFGENPQFDAVKHHLHCHGTLGASGVDAPHLVWWGGRKPAKSGKFGDGLRNAHIVSCVRRHTHEERNALDLCRALATLGVSYSFDLNETHIYCDDRSIIRSESLLRAWQTNDKPLVWLDPIGNFDLSTIEPSFDHADFAAIYEPEHGFSTTMLYFGRSAAAHDLLVHWNKLCAEFPYLPASFVLDTAWAMISAQRPLVTRWLSARNCQPLLVEARKQPVAPSLVVQGEVECRSAGFRSARRAGRAGAPEPQCIAKGRFSDDAPLTFVTVADGYPARSIASLIEAIFDAFDHDQGAFGSLATVVCRDIREMAETISAAGDSFILHAHPDTPIEPTLFAQLSRFDPSDRVSYFGTKICDAAMTQTGQDIVLTRSTIAFGRAQHFFGTKAKVAKQVLRQVK